MRWVNVRIVLGLFLLLCPAFLSAEENRPVVAGYTPFKDEEADKAYELNQKGVEFFNANDFPQALQCFEEAYALTPDDKTVMENLFAVNTHLAVDRLKKKEFEAALDYLMKARALRNAENVEKNIAFAYFSLAQEVYDKTKDVEQTLQHMEKGLEFDPNNTHMQEQASLLLYNRAMELYGQHEYKSAAAMLDRSLQYNPRQSYAHEVLGDIAYYNQDLDNAQKHWQTAGEIEPSERIVKKMSKLAGEIDVDKGLKDYPSEYFIVKYAKDEQFYSGYKIRELLRKAYRTVGNDFNYYPKRKIVVLLYGPEEMDSILSKQHWAGAVYDGKIRLPQENAGVTDANLRALIAHEYTHAIVHDLAGGKAPTWLNEGLAQWQENKVQKIDCSMLQPLIAARREFDYRKEFNQEIKTLSYEEARLFYVLAFTLTRALLERSRIYKIKEILTAVKAGDTIDTALSRTLMITPEKLNRNWNDYLRKNYK